MRTKASKLLVVLSIIFIAISHQQVVQAETCSELKGRTVYTVYTREEFLTELYNNIMNENCKVLIRMTDEALVEQMSREIGLRQKTQDYYYEYNNSTYYDDGTHIEFDDLLETQAMRYLNEDEELLNTYGVYNKYGILKDRRYATPWHNYTLEKKSDGWYWEFSYWEEDSDNLTPVQYETMMNKIATAMKSLDLASKNDYQRLKAITDWMTSNADYDYEGDCFTDYENIVLGKSVCQGYAEATELVLRAVGYKAQFVGGTTLNHAWDIVLVDNKWYMIDNTWNDSLSSYKYFLYGTDTAADEIDMGGIVDLEDYGFYKNDLSQYVTKETPLATSYYSGDSTTSYLNSWLIDITDKNVRATVGDVIPIKQDQLTQVTSSDPSIASIEDGKIVCKKAGRVNITRTDGTYVSHYFVLVSDKTSLSLSKNEYTLKKGKQATITPKVTNASKSEVKYSSSDKSVATVSKTGKIVAKKKGTATITVKLGNISKKVKIIVK